MKILEDFIKQYFKENNIPLKNRVGRSTIMLAVYGYRMAGWSPNGASKWTKSWFPNKTKGRCIYTYVLEVSDKKYCKNCNSIKDRENFNIHKNNVDGLQARCRECDKLPSRGRAAKRKSAKLQRIPSWADLKAIENFYQNCPKGYEVDHIIPLQGKTISGFHVVENLQYLTKEENQKKSNIFNETLAETVLLR